MFGISILSLAGIPLFNVFISEYLLIASFIDVRAYHLLIGFLIAYVAGMISYLKVFYEICIKPPSNHKHAGIMAINPITYIPLIILSLACIVLGIYAGSFIVEYISPATSSLIENEEYLKAVIRLTRLLS